VADAAACAGHNENRVQWRYKLESRRRESSSGEYHELESGVWSCGNAGDNRGCEFRSDTGNKYGEIQWNGGDADELECDEHCCTSTSGRNHRKCCCDGGRSGQQRGELYGHSSEFGAKHCEFESDVGSCGNAGDNRGCEFRSDTGNKYGEIQWNGGDAYELERDEHRCASAARSDDGECRGYG